MKPAHFHPLIPRDAGERWRSGRRLLASVAGRCPACGAPGAFVGAYRLRPACLGCGVVFERDAGSWLGAMVLAYAVVTMVVVLVAWWAIARDGLFPGLEWLLMATAVVAALVTYRPIKGAWLWITWAAGWVHPSGVDPERPHA